MSRERLNLVKRKGFGSAPRRECEVTIEYRFQGSGEDGLREYLVFEDVDNALVLRGRVSQYRETLERRTRGSRVVNARWTSKTISWTGSSVERDPENTWRPLHEIQSSLPASSRRNAVAKIMGFDYAVKAVA